MSAPWKADPFAPLVPVSLPAALVEQLQDEGVTPAELLAGTGIEPGWLQEAGRCISFIQFRDLIRRGQALSREPGLAFRTGARLHPGRFGVLGYALMSCATLRQAVELGLRFNELVKQSLSITLEERKGQVHVIIDEILPLGDMRAFAVEGFCACLDQLVRALVKEELSLSQASFNYPRPAHAALYEELFHCPLRFNAPRTELVFDSRLLDSPIVLANPAVTPLFERECEAELRRKDQSQSLLLRLRDALCRDIENPPDMKGMAASLGLSTRTLSRQLQENGSSYQRVLDEIRSDLAKELLRQGLGTESVARRVGFNDVTNFRKAFRRWTGLTPSAWRRLPAAQATPVA